MSLSLKEVSKFADLLVTLDEHQRPDWSKIKDQAGKHGYFAGTRFSLPEKNFVLKVPRKTIDKKIKVIGKIPGVKGVQRM